MTDHDALRHHLEIHLQLHGDHEQELYNTLLFRGYPDRNALPLRGGILPLLHDELRHSYDYQ